MTREFPNNLYVTGVEREEDTKGRQSQSVYQRRTDKVQKDKQR
jgi:hypothetical protein